MTEEKTLREELEQNFATANEIKDPADVEEVKEVVEPVIETTEAPAPVVETPEVIEPKIEAPQGWKAEMKEKWSTLPPDVQAEINRRENDMHKMFTSRDGELRLGKDMKDVIQPYMPVITAEGGNPVAAVQSLLNTAYRLRTGSPEQKAGLLREIAKQYNIPLDMAAQETQGHDELTALRQEMQQLRQQADPRVVFEQLQQQQEAVKLQSEVNAFAANPANKHYEAVRPYMVSLLTSGQAKDLQEAYDTACWANPSIRSTMLDAGKAAEAEKRKTEITAKKNAAVSIKGSPSSVQGNATPQDRTLREELAANLAAISGSKI